MLLVCHFIYPEPPIIRSIRISAMPLISAPFPYIAMHVMQTPGVGRKVGHRRGLLPVVSLGSVSIGTISIVIRQISAQGVAVVKGRAAACPAGIFPLGFTRQAVATARALAEAVAKLHGVFPAHTLHRPLVR